MFIIYGTKGVASVIGAEHFACPGCDGAHRRFARTSVQRYFTLFFIPLIPLGRVGEYFECDHCGGQFDENHLNRFPVLLEAKSQLEFIEHLKRLMVYTALADGRVDPTEIEAIRAIYKDISGNDLTRSDVEQELNLARLAKAGLSSYPRRFAGVPDDRQRETAIRVVVAVARSDGEIGPEERKLLDELAGEMSVSQADLEAILSGTTTDLGPNRLDS